MALHTGAQVDSRTLSRACPCPPISPPLAHIPLLHSQSTQICMATVYSLLYGALGRKITGEAKTA